MAFHSYGPDSAPMPTVRASAPESAAFGLRVGRLDYGLGTDWDAVNLSDTLDGSDCELILLRYPLQRLDLTEQLRLSGRPTICSDPLMYFTRRPAPQDGARVTFRRLDESDLPALDDVIESTFRGHPNHYQVNPLTRSVNIVSAYQEWARATMAGPLGMVYLAEIQGEGPIGMFSAESGTQFEVLLAGLLPSARGRGLYREMFRAITQLAFDLGAPLACTAAQASNIASMRGFTTTGYHPYLSLATVHVMR